MLSIKVVAFVLIVSPLQCSAACAIEPDDVGHVSVPEGTTSISDSAYMECTSLVSISLPSSLTQIGVQSFRQSGLTEIVIPDGVSSFGTKAFYGCTALQRVTFSAISELKEWGEETFRDCTSLNTMQLPLGLDALGYGTFNGCTSLTLVIIDNNPSMRTIGHSAFMDTPNLDKVLVPWGCGVDAAAFSGTNVNGWGRLPSLASAHAQIAALTTQVSQLQAQLLSCYRFVETSDGMCEGRLNTPDLSLRLTADVHVEPPRSPPLAPSPKASPPPASPLSCFDHDTGTLVQSRDYSSHCSSDCSPITATDASVDGLFEDNNAGVFYENRNNKLTIIDFQQSVTWSGCATLKWHLYSGAGATGSSSNGIAILLSDDPDLDYDTAAAAGVSSGTSSPGLTVTMQVHMNGRYLYIYNPKSNGNGLYCHYINVACQPCS